MLTRDASGPIEYLDTVLQPGHVWPYFFHGYEISIA